MLKHFCLVFLVIFAVSCSTTIKVDPFPGKQSVKKDCKDDCKGLKGKQRADCNKRCN